MAKLEFSPEELKVLAETLERGVSDLEVEVSHTDSHDFKDVLKRRKAVMDRLLGKVQATVVPA
ncbi:MAG: hypothetical protein MUE94_06510 [Verrucomicrobia bacterium]|jgi:hypothetical protein|nr:hypothetical protein [Verrucomicrobiota bacterium]